MKRRTKFIIAGGAAILALSLGTVAYAWFYYKDQQPVALNAAHDISITTNLYHYNYETQEFETPDDAVISSGNRSLDASFTFSEWKGSFVCEGNDSEYYLYECSFDDTSYSVDSLMAAVDFGLSLSSATQGSTVRFKLADVSYAFGSDSTRTVSSDDDSVSDCAKELKGLSFTKVSFSKTDEDGNEVDSGTSGDTFVYDDESVAVDLDDAAFVNNGKIHFYVYIKISADDKNVNDNISAVTSTIQILNQFTVKPAVRTIPAYTGE